MDGNTGSFQEKSCIIPDLSGYHCLKPVHLQQLHDVLADSRIAQNKAICLFRVNSPFHNSLL